ncbi:MAG: SH3 domain-containing protein [Planktothrix sp.]|uniref:SH3 domain-containing protein n=1 Tax=Planktothrix sp. TaxID=3088171 RepID=UPI0038D4682A
MNNFRLRSQSFRVLAFVVLAVMGSQLPTLANIQTKPSTANSDSQMAQSRSSLCRRIGEPQGLAVHARPTPNSPVVGGVGFKTEVTVVDTKGTRGPDGRTWIEITAPVKGYISNGFPDETGNLLDCENQSENPKPTPVSLCRQVDLYAAPRGVVVRENRLDFPNELGV